MGRRVAGIARLAPWPMHVYDNLVYDPQLDALIMTSSPKHNYWPALRAATDRTWIYDLEKRQWRIFDNDGKPPPNFFGGGSAYDEARNTIVAYNALIDETLSLPIGTEGNAARAGIWELGPERHVWKLATPESCHSMWFQLAYHAKRGDLVVFGDRPGTNRVWVYTPGPMAGSRGRWRSNSPQGDHCPKSGAFPVAYHPGSALFLLLPVYSRTGVRVTCLYDLEHNRYSRVEARRLPKLGMNYTMIYHKRLDVFVLVTGSYLSKKSAEIWVLRLDPATL